MTCIKCTYGEPHPFHDNGSINEAFDIADLWAPTIEGDGYDADK